MPALSDTRFFKEVQEGSLPARDRLYEAGYPRLRFIAASLLRRERPDHTLQPTALVGEFFLKLRGSERVISSLDHFYGLAARAMRQVLIDHSRVRNARKKVAPESVPALLAVCDASSSVIALSVRAVFHNLERLDARVASTVWLRSAEGLTWAELSKLQNRELWRVRADFDFGIRWMADKIRA